MVEEKKLPKFSYSKLDTFVQCPMKYKFKYVDGNYESTEAIHLDLGNIAHKILEIKHRNIIEGESVDYNYLYDVLENGVAEETEKDKGNFLIGLNSISNKYGNDAFTSVNEKSNLSYNDKIETFKDYIIQDNVGEEWKPIAVEVNFQFEYKGKAILHGFIDRVDENILTGALRVADYKSSNKLFEHKDLTTPLQMFIYTLACEHMYGKTPEHHLYDMIFLGDKQLACTKGYYKRAEKKLDKIIDEILLAEQTGMYKPKPTPLCHWCDFSKTNPNAAFYLQGLCDYHSMWTPTNKTFSVNKSYT